MLAVVAFSLGFAPSALAAEPGQITGTVTNASTAGLVSGVEVCAYLDYLGGSGCATTESSGAYLIAGLKAGEYKVEFSARDGNYLPQFYDGKASASEAQLVPVAAGQVTSGIDAELQEGARIAGRVTDAATQEAVDGLEVCAIAVSGGEAWCGTTVGGEYDVVGLPSGGYRVQFGGEYARKFNYVPQYYDDTGASFEAETVSVLEGSVTSGIDAQMREGGRIAGTVSAPGGGLTPYIGDVNVCAYTVAGEFRGCGNPKLNGEYAIEGLESGEYKVGFGTFGLNYLPQYYDDKASLGEAEQVSVTVGHTTPEVNAKLSSAGEITGQVTNVATKAPIQGIQVCVEPSAWAHCAWTDSNGEYLISELESGEYQLEFSPDGLDYSFLRRSASVIAGQVTAGVDATLTEGGRMSGRVTDAVTGEAIEDVEACALEIGGDDSECGTTNASGEYTILRLSGEYRVRFSARSGDYLGGFYGDKASFAESEALPISVTAPGTTSGIDIAMQPGRFAVPANTAPPAISGTAAVGDTLSCSNGSWSGNPAPTFTYGWLRDGKWITGARESTYTAQAPDEGHSLSCEVFATSTAGDMNGSEHAFSANVMIAAGSATAPPSGSIAPALSTAPPASLPDSTPPLATAPLVTLMASTLVVSGDSAPVRVECRDATCKGSIELAVQVAAKRHQGRSAGARMQTLVLATGSFSLAEGKAGPVLLRLTSAGRQRLAHAHRHPIAAKLILSVKGGQPTTRSVLAV